MYQQDDDNALLESSGLVQMADSTTNSRAASRADCVDGQGVSRRGSLITKEKRVRYESLAMLDILLERRGSRYCRYLPLCNNLFSWVRKMSVVMQGKDYFLVDA